MRKVYIFLFFIIIGQIACKQKNNKIIEDKKPLNEAYSFFPVVQIIRGELAEIDSLPVTPLKIKNVNGKEDSTWMKKTDIRRFAEPFLHPEIDSMTQKESYKQTSFLDQTINAFTFSYDLIPGMNDTAQIKSWNVYVDPVTNKILRIYIVKELKANAVNETLQLTWKFGEWCKITSITEAPGKPPQIWDEKMIWDFNE